MCLGEGASGIGQMVLRDDDCQGSCSDQWDVLIQHTCTHTHTVAHTYTNKNMLCMHTHTYSHAIIFKHMYPHKVTLTNTLTHTYVCTWSPFTSDPRGRSVTSGRAKGGRKGQKSRGGERGRWQAGKYRRQED